MPNAHIWPINKHRFYLNGYGDNNNGHCYNKLYRMTEAIQFFDCMECDIVHTVFVTLLAKVHTKKLFSIEMFAVGTNIEHPTLKF